MIRFVFASVVCILLTAHKPDTGKEKAIKAYYAGFESHDWNLVASQLAEGFTFTSPNNDDHISTGVFREKCWVTNTFVKKVNFIKMTSSGDDIFLLVEITTTDNKIVRNTDLFTFSDGRIRSVEVFFGAGPGYPGR